MLISLTEVVDPHQIISNAWSHLEDFSAVNVLILGELSPHEVTQTTDDAWSSPPPNTEN